MAVSFTLALSAQLVLYLIAIALFVAGAVVKDSRVNFTRLGFAFALAGFVAGRLLEGV